MKSLYIECSMGAAGDMLLAALIELMPEPERFIERLNNIGIPNVTYRAAKAEKCGIYGTQIDVSVHGEVEHEHHHDRSAVPLSEKEQSAPACGERGHHHHHHSSMHDIEHIISRLDVPESVKENAVAVYKVIAAAESEAHGRPVEEIHFHEVGAMDAVADVTGVCLAVAELAPERIVASAVNVGGGTVHCAHGILPVPAPATANILKGIPSYGGRVKSELCTPTGAALLKTFVSEFSEMPVMRVDKIGYGMGHKDFDTANCVRIMLGETGSTGDEVAELRCNLDDMTGESIGYAVEVLYRAGALDVYTIPIGMKKNRPGILLTCMCRMEDRERLLSLIMKHTSTLGVREYICRRYTLERGMCELDTNYGRVRAKRSTGMGITRIKPEYEDMKEIADKNGIALSDIKPVW